jgi:hypothetical protein
MELLIEKIIEEKQARTFRGERSDVVLIPCTILSESAKWELKKAGLEVVETKDVKNFRILSM